MKKCRLKQKISIKITTFVNLTLRIGVSIIVFIVGRKRRGMRKFNVSEI